MQPMDLYIREGASGTSGASGKRRDGKKEVGWENRGGRQGREQEEEGGKNPSGVWRPVETGDFGLMERVAARLDSLGGCVPNDNLERARRPRRSHRETQ